MWEILKKIADIKTVITGRAMDRVLTNSQFKALIKRYPDYRFYYRQFATQPAIGLIGK